MGKWGKLHRWKGEGSFGSGSQFRNERSRGGGEGRGRNRYGRHRNYNRGGRQRFVTPHSRSLYQSSINTGELAIEYAELNPYIVTSDDGRMSIDFESSKALCALTKVLAKRDFGLDLELSYDKIVPHLQLRYSYLLWVEDLLEKWPSETRGEVVNGIDIGSNASVLYALVAAKKNSWKILTSEYDETILSAAERNIRSNHLEDLVTVKKVDDRTFLEGVIDPKVLFYDFCMFSPPVFKFKEAKMMSLGKLESGEKFAKRKVTGRAAEMIVDEGEKNLMMNVVRESIKLKNKIKVFTIMVGQRNSVEELGFELKKLVDDDFVGTFAFSYGFQEAYGMAWTFDRNVKLKNVDRLKFFHYSPAKSPLEHAIDNMSLSSVFNRVIELLEEAMVNYKVLEKSDEKYSLEISTYYHFWVTKSKKAQDFKNEALEKYNEAKKRKLDDNDGSSGSLTKVFHNGDTLVFVAVMDIVQQEEEGNGVLIKMEVTGGVAAQKGVNVLYYFARNLT